ncbi:MAG: glycosyltransferase family 2 protein [Verrucomicrobia bacterium]|nr:glycosyltransferase family 2 protein [Verrucomicrobiota bacterium]
MERSELAIVIPAFNEAGTIEEVVRQVSPSGAVIVVDDGSSDSTAERAAAGGAIVVRHPVNRGYDAALNTGFAEADARRIDFALTFDADGQHDAGLVRAFHQSLTSGADLVLGVRPSTARLGEAIFALVGRALWGMRDPMCGMKAYRMSVYRSLGCFDSYGSVGTQLALHAIRTGGRVVEIDVPIAPRKDAPRFGRILRANWKILRALLLGLAYRGNLKSRKLS